MASAWQRDTYTDTPAVAYWKEQTRHWQTIAALAFMAGVLLGTAIGMVGTTYWTQPPVTESGTGRDEGRHFGLDGDVVPVEPCGPYCEV